MTAARQHAIDRELVLTALLHIAHNVQSAASFVADPAPTPICDLRAPVWCARQPLQLLHAYLYRPSAHSEAALRDWVEGPNGAESTGATAAAALRFAAMDLPTDWAAFRSHTPLHLSPKRTPTDWSFRP